MDGKNFNYDDFTLKRVNVPSEDGNKNILINYQKAI
jgi:hypothetical protein